jgi:O-succinylbenzoate synthase
VSLLAADVAANPLAPAAGLIDVRRVTPDPALLDRHAAGAERTEWWHARLERCLALLG